MSSWTMKGMKELPPSIAEAPPRAHQQHAPPFEGSSRRQVAVGYSCRVRERGVAGTTVVSPASHCSWIRLLAGRSPRTTVSCSSGRGYQRGGRRGFPWVFRGVLLTRRERSEILDTVRGAEPGGGSPPAADRTRVDSMRPGRGPSRPFLFLFSEEDVGYRTETTESQ